MLSPRAPAYEPEDGEEDEEDEGGEEDEEVDEVYVEKWGATIVDALNELTDAVRQMPGEVAKVMREEKSRKRKERSDGGGAGDPPTYTSRGVGASP